MKQLVYLLMLGLIPAISEPAQGQSAGVALHVGTLGLGGDVGVGLGGRAGLRAGANVFPFDIDLTASDISYNVNLPSPQFTLMLDFYLVGGFRLSGGALISSDKLQVNGQFSGVVEIGDSTYTDADVGSLTGTIVTNDVSPYVGIGFGGPGRGRFGLFLDLGVAFQGRPSVEVQADGLVANDPGFQTDLEIERQGFEDDIEPFRFYPVFTIGFSIGL